MANETVTIDPEIFDAVDTELAERNLYEFVKQAWSIVEPTEKFVANWHIEAICNHLEAVCKNEITDLLINIAPGTGKSLVVSVFFPAWVWIQEPSARWLFASYAQELSTRDSLRCRYIIESEWYKSRWGDRFALQADENQKMHFANDQTGWRMATSVGGRGTGSHPSFVVIDDPHNVSQAESDTERQGAIEWWKGTISTRGQTRNVRRVVIMQRLHESDLSGHILKTGGFEHICIPMKFGSDRMQPTRLGWSDPRTEDGELMWPAVYTAEKVEKLERELGSVRAAGQLQQRPSPAGGFIFKQANLRWFREESNGSSAHDATFVLQDEHQTRSFFANQCAWFQACDTAQKIKKTNDYTAVVTVAVTPEKDILIYDMFRAKIEVPRQFDVLIQQRQKYPWLRFQAIEDQGSGVGLIQQGRVLGIPFRTLKANADKVSRSSTMATFYENHKVWHKANAPWLSDCEQELLLFPNGEHDDMVDVLAYAGQLVVSDSIVGMSDQIEYVYTMPAEMTDAEKKSVADFVDKYG